MKRLDDKITLVTGAARGIGAAIARAFAAEGARVWVTDIETVAGARVADEIGQTARFLRLDVRQEADWQSAMETVLVEHGRLDVLVGS